MATVDDLRDAIAECLDGRLCVQAWVGYGSAIFVGFGDEVIPRSLLEENHRIPLYELQTSFANWHVQGPDGVIGTSDDEHDIMTKGVEALVGHRVLTWQYDAVQQALAIVFDGELSLHVVPYVSAKFPDGEAWWLVFRDQNRVIGANSDLSVSEDRYSR